jgi:hypothetical protein
MLDATLRGPQCNRRCHKVHATCGLASINLNVMKSNVKSKLPGLIAAATILSAS